jgi:hypothetical protein
MKENFTNLWELNKFPLTDLLGTYDSSIQVFDQALTISEKNGHVQLANIIPNEILYTESDYSYRTRSSPKSSNLINFFTNFLDENTPQRVLNSIVDIGGNDLTLAKILKPKTKECYVVDPLCSLIDGQKIDNINVIGKKVEEVDLKVINPDVVVCRHTLEHIENPKVFLRQLFEECPDNCIYIFEVPDFDCLLEGMRFDAIFHQHLHYFNLSTITNLISECGGVVTNHDYNFQGSCGGALFVSFTKSKQIIPSIKIDISAKKKMIKKKIDYYKIHMSNLSNQIENLPKPIYGYGAGLMLATYGYHLKTDFSFLEAIIDDDITKDNTGYKNIPVIIRHPSKLEIPKDSSFIITSLENIRPIYNRLSSFRPRRVLTHIVS